MKAIIYILSFILFLGTSSFLPVNECSLLSNTQTCHSIQNNKTPKGCCDTEKKITCECCKIVAILKTEKTEDESQHKCILKTPKGDSGTPKSYSPSYFHPPKNV